MKPVLILQNMRHDGPAYLATWLARQGVAYELVDASLDHPLPSSISSYAALAVLGGAMSANDPLPFLRGAEQLILEAMDLGRPVIGHCLGGQLMSRALGGSVGRNPVKEIGWGEIQVADVPEARHWLGDVAGFESFHWHGETFSIPPGATRIAGNAHCANQMFVMGPHLGMQCHVEITPEMIRTWCRDWDKERVGEPPERIGGGSMQPAQVMQVDMERRCDALHRVAARLYRRWSERLSGEK